MVGMIVASMVIAMLKTLPCPPNSTRAGSTWSCWRSLLCALCLLANGCVVNPVPTPGGGGFAANNSMTALDGAGGERAPNATGSGGASGEQDKSAQDAGSTTKTDADSTADGQQVDGDRTQNDVDKGGQK